MTDDSPCENCAEHMEAGIAGAIETVREMLAKEEAKPRSKYSKTRQTRETRIRTLQTVERRLTTMFNRQTRKRRGKALKDTLAELGL